MSIIQEIMMRRADELLTNARDRTPVVTGRMRDSWRTNQISDNVVEIINDAPYSKRVLDYSPNAEGLRELLDE